MVDWIVKNNIAFTGITEWKMILYLKYLLHKSQVCRVIFMYHELITRFDRQKIPQILYSFFATLPGKYL